MEDGEEELLDLEGEEEVGAMRLCVIHPRRGWMMMVKMTENRKSQMPRRRAGVLECRSAGRLRLSESWALSGGCHWCRGQPHTALTV